MKLKTVIRLLLFIFSLVQLYSCKVSVQKPNIIIILVDDLGYGEPEVYNQDSKIPMWEQTV